MRYVIVGNSAAGNAAAQSIRRFDANGEVVIFSDEQHPSYYRPLLPLVIEDASERTNLYRDSLHTPENVDVRAGVGVHAVLPKTKEVALQNGEHMKYDRLLLATGASPVLPDISGITATGVFVLRSLQDAFAIRWAAERSRRIVIVGGGRIGVKTALAMRNIGVKVTIVEMLPWIIPNQFDEETARILEDALKKKGIEMIFCRKARKILKQNKYLTGILLDDGKRLDADFIVFATGIKANAHLARRAGIQTRRGVLVDSRLQTSSPDIYAAGDVVETTDLVTGAPMVSGTWTNAVAMGHVAGENMAGEEREFMGALSLQNALDIAGIPVISAGVIHPPAGKRYEVSSLRLNGSYRKLVFRNGKLAGFILLGDISQAGLYTTLVRERSNIEPFRNMMANGTFRYANRLLSHIAEESKKQLVHAP